MKEGKGAGWWERGDGGCRGPEAIMFTGCTNIWVGGGVDKRKRMQNPECLADRR